MRKFPIAPEKSSISSLKQKESLALPAPPELPSTSSRRNLLVRPLEMAAVLGAFQMLNPAEAIADNSGGGQIDPSLVSDLQFARKNSADPGAVFSSAGLLVGFGPNLLHCATDTCRLFIDKRPVLTCVSIQDVDEFIPELTVGTSGTLTQTIRDGYGRTITSTLVVTSINDLPDDFLVTGKTDSLLYTGAFFEIAMNVKESNGVTSQIKTTYDILTRSFPLGVNLSLGLILL
jgi:hypothetical protein